MNHDEHKLVRGHETASLVQTSGSGLDTRKASVALRIRQEYADVQNFRLEGDALCSHRVPLTSGTCTGAIKELYSLARWRDAELEQL